MAGNSLENPYTILEVGCGHSPFPGKGERLFLPGDRYIGIDLFPNYSDSKIRGIETETRSLYAMRGDPDMDISIQRGDARNLPFEAGAIDELVFVNVFGDHRTFNHQPQFRQEALRVMHAAGSLTVVETLSTSGKPLEVLREEMREDGLVLFNRGFTSSPAVISQYAFPSQKIRLGLIDRAYAATFISPQVTG